VAFHSFQESKNSLIGKRIRFGLAFSPSYSSAEKLLFIPFFRFLSKEALSFAKAFFLKKPIVLL